VQQDFFIYDGTRIAYTEWGPAEGPVILAVHGLTCNGRDFDELAAALAGEGYRFIAPDLPGRGRSDFLDDPAQYRHAEYVRCLGALMAHLGVTQYDMIGTSLGGLLGMRMAARPESGIQRLILNDIGPEVPQEALDFIRLVLSETYTFESAGELEERLRATRGLTWGPLTDAQWAHMTQHNQRIFPDGNLSYAYDPAINARFEDEPVGDVDLWACLESIACPLLLIKGGQSLLLNDDIVKKMQRSQPDMDIIVYEDCGHVPSLMAPQHIEDIKSWLTTAQIS